MSPTYFIGHIFIYKEKGIKDNLTLKYFQAAYINFRDIFIILSRGELKTGMKVLKNANVLYIIRKKEKSKSVIRGTIKRNLLVVHYVYCFQELFISIIN